MKINKVIKEIIITKRYDKNFPMVKFGLVLFWGKISSSLLRFLFISDIEFLIESLISSFIWSIWSFFIVAKAFFGNS